MQPSAALNANRRVVSQMRTAHLGAERAHDLVVKGKLGPAHRFAEFSLTTAQDVLSGVRELEASRTNMLDGTARRFAAHAVRHLEDAVAQLESGARLERRTSLEKSLLDAEVSTRLGLRAAERSLANPRLRPVEEPSSSGRAAGSGTSAASGTSAGSGTSSVPVDGVRLDDLGNPARGDGSWSGPDGERYDSSGAPAPGDGSHGGFDGSGYSGI